MNLFTESEITDRKIVIKRDDGQNYTLLKGGPEQIEKVHSQISKFIHDKKINIVCPEVPFDSVWSGNH